MLCEGPTVRLFLKNILAGVFLLGVISLATAAESRGVLWNRVEIAMTNGLPKTAITNLQIVLEGALGDRAYPEAAKAMAERAALESLSENDSAAAKIKRLESAMSNVPAEMNPILHTILALWYWQYFQEHRWQFARRTATQSTPGNDFTTWDLSHLFAEIERQFQIALEADKTLKAMPIGDWGFLLEKGDMPDAMRPTVYDFIAHEALGFYLSGEEPTKPEEKFEISTNDPVFESAEKFLQWQPMAEDTNSPQFKALRLWQDLLRFHQNDPPPMEAFAAVDLDRLSWANSVASWDVTGAHYTNALEAFIQNHLDSEISSLARNREAQQIYWNGDSATAHRIAKEGERRFLKSSGGELCHNLLLQIEAKWAEISTERVWNAPWPKIAVEYDNIDSIYFRAIPVNWETFLERRHNRPENLSEKERQEFLRLKPALEWSAHLPPTPDYKETNFNLSAPGTLKPGFYFIAASHKSDRMENSTASLTPVWLSDLSLVLLPRDGFTEGFVAKADSGEPVAGAEISAWRLDDHGNRIPLPTMVTDSNGFFGTEPHARDSYLFLARYKGQEISSGDIETADKREPPEKSTAMFFTDRGIYRPGQIIRVRGICLEADPKGVHSKLITNKIVTVVFYDVNDQEIARQKCRVNDYGSFTGSFTAPRNRLMGVMDIRAGDSIVGQTSIRIRRIQAPEICSDAGPAEIRAETQYSGRSYWPCNELHRRCGGQRTGFLPHCSADSYADLVVVPSKWKFLPGNRTRLFQNGIRWVV